VVEVRRSVLLVASAVAALVMASGVALAAVSSSPDAGTINTDGRISAILSVGNRIYLGGSFTHVDGVERNHLAAIDASTGQLTNWNPAANNNVFSLAASPDGSTIYAGGGFTEVGGTARRRLVSLDASSGTVNTDFNIALGAPVRAIAVSGNSLYIGGDFTSVKGQSRSRLALINGTTGDLDPNWVPTADSSVWTLVFSPDGSRIYAGGDFANVSGQPRPYLVGLDPTTGATTWEPLTNPNGIVYTIATQGANVYSAEGGPGGEARSYDALSGELVWKARGDGDPQTVAALDGTLYIGGHFLKFMGKDRPFFAAVDATTGQLDPSWNPVGSGAGKGVWALTPNALGTQLYAGGDFTGVSGVTHKRFAQFSNTPQEPPPGACTITGTSSADTLTGTSGDDVICGGEGNDVIKGLEGNDILKGEKGSDKLYGGDGDDTLDGGLGTDNADFSSAPAAITASLIDNTASGEGSDTLADIEILIGSSNNDTLTGSSASNTLNGGAGADTLSGQAGADKLVGNGGNDTERGGLGSDTVIGSGGADDLFGEEGDDTVDSQDGVNGNDSLNGGSQVNGDTAITDATEKSIVDFP
jgi:Ca2+-binding RTX toxin-like protein